MRKICIIANKYPTPLDKNVNVFIQQLVMSMADHNISCLVIYPMPVNINVRFFLFPYHTTEKTDKGNIVDLYFPKYIGFGQRGFLGIRTARMTTWCFSHAVMRVIKKLVLKPDALYGHFVTPAGVSAAIVGKKFSIPAFLGYGEASLATICRLGNSFVKEKLTGLAGVVAVSTKNKQMLVNSGVIGENKIQIFPNAVQDVLFYPRDRRRARMRYGFPQDKFIIAFVGSFDERKGINRLLSAIDHLDDVFVICAGRGPIVPKSEHVLFRGPVLHDDLPWFYSAADIFVLPTRNEGCCNAIIEAMACGLPIISSNMFFNDDILDASCSIRVDPDNIEQISDAVKVLQVDKKYREELAAGCLVKAKDLTLPSRAQRIIEYFSQKCAIRQE